jgi:hypothetical protein
MTRSLDHLAAEYRRPTPDIRGRRGPANFLRRRAPLGVTRATVPGRWSWSYDRLVVERVQVSAVTASSRWWAGSASVYCLAVGLVVYSAEDADFRDAGWALSAIVAAVTAIPQLFRGRVPFVVACWLAIALILPGGVFTMIVGGCLFLPAALLLLGAAVLPGRAGPFVADGRSHREGVRATTRRLTAAAAIAVLLIFLAAVAI